MMDWSYVALFVWIIVVPAALTLWGLRYSGVWPLFLYLMVTLAESYFIKSFVIVVFIIWGILIWASERKPQKKREIHFSDRL